MHLGNKFKTFYIADDGNTRIFIYLKCGLARLIVDPHNDLQPVGLIAQWSTAPAAQRSGFESPFGPEFFRPFSLLLKQH